MIRQPTDLDDTLEWWRRTVSGERVPRIEDEPQCGFYKRRFVRGGPFVPVAIWLHQEIDPETGELETQEETAVAAFISPAHTLSGHAAYVSDKNAPTLPLFAYGAVGFANGRFYVCAKRVDADKRQLAIRALAAFGARACRADHWERAGGC